MLTSASSASYNSTTCFFSLKIKKFDFDLLKFGFVIFAVCCLKFSAQLSKPRCLEEFLFIAVTLCFQLIENRTVKPLISILTISQNRPLSSTSLYYSTNSGILERNKATYSLSDYKELLNLQ